MSPLIELNGRDIRGYNLCPLEGTIATLLTPPKYKKMVSNDNGFIHGALLLSSPSARRIDKREVSLSFFLEAASTIDAKTELDNLVDLLVNGVSESGVATGVNTFTLPEYGICMRLVFSEVSKFTPWLPHGSAVVTLKFVEPNPNNRNLPTA